MDYGVNHFVEAGLLPALVGSSDNEPLADRQIVLVGLMSA